MPMPNFLIIGAGRTGTSSLTMYLTQHAEVYISPIKEPRFFVFVGQDRKTIDHPFPGDLISNIEAYRALFDGVTTEKAIGEASTEYLTRPGTWRRIKHFVPEARIIVGLRNPADRLFSYFMFSVREGLEPETDFAIALARDQERKPPQKRGYSRLGRYAPFLRPYFSCFPRQNIHTYLFEDLVQDPVSVVREICAFLDISTDFEPDTSTVYNPGRATGSASEDLFFDQRLRDEMLQAALEDISETQALTGRDLSSWLEGFIEP